MHISIHKCFITPFTQPACANRLMQGSLSPSVQARISLQAPGPAVLQFRLRPAVTQRTRGVASNSHLQISPRQPIRDGFGFQTYYVCFVLSEVILFLALEILYCISYAWVRCVEDEYWMDVYCTYCTPSGRVDGNTTPSSSLTLKGLRGNNNTAGCR
jgi:hypothetical protein